MYVAFLLGGTFKLINLVQLQPQEQTETHTHISDCSK